MKIKKLFQKGSLLFFPSGKAVQVFHIIVLNFWGGGGVKDEAEAAPSDDPKLEFSSQEMITVGTLQWLKAPSPPAV